jgi:hypothetical protein
MKRMEGFMMGDNYLTEPVTYQECGDCGHALLTSDKFCRRCGAKQGVQANSPTQGIQSDRLDLIKEADNEREQPAPSYTTAPLAQMSDTPSSYRPVSGSLVNALVDGMADASAAQLCSHFRKADGLFQANKFYFFGGISNGDYRLM